MSQLTAPAADCVPAAASGIPAGAGAKTRRQTNIELCRIVAMIFVLVLHADFVSFGVPGQNLTPGTVGRVFAEMMSVVSVNAFVMISGWFGINASLRGFFKFLFQCVFFFATPYIVFVCVKGPEALSWIGVAGCFVMGPAGWFVKAYMGLYLLAPLLNIALQRLTQRRLGVILVMFYCYQTIWGWVGENNSIGSGYTTLSFVGLYLLARYMRQYGLQQSSGRWFALYGLCVVVLTASFFVLPQALSVTSYANPIVVAGALCLFMGFATLKMRYNAGVNAVAASVFAVYLLHSSYIMIIYYQNFVKRGYAVAGLAGIVGVIAAYFVAGIVADRLRLFLWRLIAGRGRR